MSRVADIDVLQRTPGILTLIANFHLDDKNACILTEYASGGDWSKTFHQNWTVKTFQEIATSIIQPLESLCAMQARSWVHRDLDDENILVRGNDTQDSIIGDLGNAIEIIPHRGWPKPCLGKPNFWAVECDPQTDVHTFKTDVWTFGLAIYKTAFPFLRWKPLLDKTIRNGRADFIRKHYPELQAGINGIPSRFKRDPEGGRLFQDLLSQMLALEVEDRCNAETARRHPFFAEYYYNDRSSGQDIRGPLSSWKGKEAQRPEFGQSMTSRQMSQGSSHLGKLDLGSLIDQLS